MARQASSWVAAVLSVETHGSASIGEIKNALPSPDLVHRDGNTQFPGGQDPFLRRAGGIEFNFIQQEDRFASRCQSVGREIKMPLPVPLLQLQCIVSFALVAVCEKEMFNFRSLGRLLLTQNHFLLLLCSFSWRKKKKITFSFLAIVFSICSCLWSSGTVSFLHEAGICSLVHRSTFPSLFLRKAFLKNHLSKEVFMYCPSSLVLANAWFMATSCSSHSREGLLAITLEVPRVSNDHWLYWKRMLQWQQAAPGWKEMSLVPEQ